MSQDKKEYIQEQIDTDYVVKSRNSSLGFLMVAVLYIFFNKQESNYKIYVTILAMTVLVLSVLRIANVNRYNEKKLTLNEAVRNVSTTAIINGILWSIIGIAAVFSFTQLNIQILTTFIILITFCASAIVTLSHKRAVLISTSAFFSGSTDFLFYSSILRNKRCLKLMDLRLYHNQHFL